MTAPIRNLTVVRDCTFHTFLLTFKPDLDFGGLEAEAARIVAKHYGPHREDASGAHVRIERWSGGILDPESRVRPSITDFGKYRLTITLFCPTRLAEPLEDAITWDVVALCRARRNAEA